MTKQKGFAKFNVASKWKRKYWGWAPDEGWFILTNFQDVDSAILAYKKRFGIEEMFRDFKRGGYNERRNKSYRRATGRDSFTNCYCLYNCYNTGEKDEADGNTEIHWSGEGSKAD